MIGTQARINTTPHYNTDKGTGKQPVPLLY